MNAAPIVISYRRDDAPGHAGRLYDGLAARFGGEQVFMDIDAIEPGIDFAQQISAVIGRCQVLLVIIGPRWLQMADRYGNRRLDAPGDYVRMEIETALSHGVLVIPVLVHGAAMPSTDDLPPSVNQLAFRNAVELSDIRWHLDVGRLIRFLENRQREAAASDRGRRDRSAYRPAGGGTAYRGRTTRPRARSLVRSPLGKGILVSMPLS
ncbi:MAG: TIR domain-containing protein [Streptosporangiales bacterium]|nr:TIR domain-containing protein [Streptosporangiales bacterium]